MTGQPESVGAVIMTGQCDLLGFGSSAAISACGRYRYELSRRWSDGTLLNVGALTAAHVGLTVAVRRGRNILTGPLMGCPTASMTRPLLVLRLGDFAVALHPGQVVMVIPDGYKATITVAPHPAGRHTGSTGK